MSRRVFFDSETKPGTRIGRVRACQKFMEIVLAILIRIGLGPSGRAVLAKMAALPVVGQMVSRVHSRFDVKGEMTLKNESETT
ncbi:MAG: hypothetical protein HY735_06220 [Verrucomicrobia bacterium]|nr:hypothetical protein [Verrucomicrobiota bacterium]